MEVSPVPVIEEEVGMQGAVRGLGWGASLCLGPFSGFFRLDRLERLDAKRSEGCICVYGLGFWPWVSCTVLGIWCGNV